MSQHSPNSSGVDPSSSPFAGTDPTLYSPEVVRGPRSNIKHRRNNFSTATIVASGNQALQGRLIKPEKQGVLPQPVPYEQGTFVNDISEDDTNFISRFQFVSRLPDGTNGGTDSEHELFSVQHQMKLYACFANSVPLYTRGVNLRFDDLREATEAKDILEQHDFTVDYITGYQFALAKGQDTAQLNEFEGQIQLSIMIEPKSDHVIWSFGPTDLSEMTAIVEQVCGIYGPLRNCVHVQTDDARMLLTFRVEFYSVDAAHRAICSLRLEAIYSNNVADTYHWVTAHPAPWTGERALNSPHRTKPRIDDQGRFVMYRPAANPFTGQPYYRHPADQHNRVRRERILDGSDVRTTVMLRNIPNKLDWMSLKAILDDACFGTYDFVYLRIDFKSGCNVGYAFINFADVHGMIALIDKIERRCWVGFHSTKAAEISYATIQGREALIQKFRNSSVMQETPYCRPRLFVTHLDAELSNRIRSTGTEQAFPRPDNLSKLQRSMDSARSVGLFPPHGSYPMPEHRNRTSAYDRGTPRDMMQAAMQFAHQRTAPVGFRGLDEDQKRNVEVWYTYNFGQGHNGSIPFDYIPMTHVAQYFSEQQSGPAAMAGNFGVIGRPSYTGEHFNGATTPTRVSRQYYGSGHSRFGHGMSETNNMFN